MNREDIIEALKQLADLRQAQVLNEEEFSAEKESLLAQLRRTWRSSSAPPTGAELFPTASLHSPSPSFPGRKEPPGAELFPAASISDPEESSALAPDPEEEQPPHQAAEKRYFNQAPEKQPPNETTEKQQLYSIPPTLPLPSLCDLPPTSALNPEAAEERSPLPQREGKASGAAEGGSHLPQREGELLFGRYAIEALLGSGGAGQVFQVYDRLLGRRVALKRLHPHWRGHPLFRQRFLQEMRLQERLYHPGLVRLLEVGEHPSTGELYLTMERIKGESLALLLRRCLQQNQRPPLPPRTTLSLLRDLASILDYAHEQGVIHRDLKPANILLPCQGGVKLLDFGIARQLNSPEQLHTGSVGSAYYMAPEQLRGGTVLSPAADIYSLAMIAHELLTGELAQGFMPAASQLIPQLPSALDLVLRRALSFEPAQRHPSAGAFVAELERVLVQKTKTELSPLQLRPSLARSSSPLAEIVARQQEGLFLWATIHVWQGVFALGETVQIRRQGRLLGKGRIRLLRPAAPGSSLSSLEAGQGGQREEEKKEDTPPTALPVEQGRGQGEDREGEGQEDTLLCLSLASDPEEGRAHQEQRAKESPSLCSLSRLEAGQWGSLALVGFAAFQAGDRLERLPEADLPWAEILQIEPSPGGVAVRIRQCWGSFQQGDRLRLLRHGQYMGNCQLLDEPPPNKPALLRLTGFTHLRPGDRLEGLTHPTQSTKKV